jgi:hypothetical protein
VELLTKPVLAAVAQIRLYQRLLHAQVRAPPSWPGRSWANFRLF